MGYVMKIILFGASGFIGRQVVQLLSECTDTAYQVQRISSSQIDFVKPLTDEQLHFLKSAFSGADAVINMVGLMSDDKGILESVHHHTPVRLATLAKACGVSRWVQLSALGADADHQVAFSASKGWGDSELLALSDGRFSVAVARADLVYGVGGDSTELFKKLIRCGVVALPKGGRQRVAPVAVADVARGLLALLGCDKSGVVNFVGTSCTFAEYLNALYQMDKPNKRLIVLTLPSSFVPVCMRLARLVFGSLINPDTLTLLDTHPTADGIEFARLLGYMPKGYNEFLTLDKQ